jgi:hypothetical protein
MSVIRIQLFRRSFKPFCDLLREKGIEFTVRTPEPGRIMNSAEIVDILVGAGAVLTPLAVVVREWIRSSASRKLNITLTGRSATFVTEGFSEDQIKELLKEAQGMTVIDASKPTENEDRQLSSSS